MIDSSGIPVVTLTLPVDDVLDILEGLDKLYASSLRRCATVRPGTPVRTALDSRARRLQELMVLVKKGVDDAAKS